jgi:hypothetical protein
VLPSVPLCRSLGREKHSGKGTPIFETASAVGDFKTLFHGRTIFYRGGADAAEGRRKGLKSRLLKSFVQKFVQTAPKLCPKCAGGMLSRLPQNPLQFVPAKPCSDPEATCHTENWLVVPRKCSTRLVKKFPIQVFTL